MNIRTLIYLVVFSLLAGCSVIPSGQSNNTLDNFHLKVADKAKQLEKEGNFLAAAHEYQNLARSIRPPTQQNYQLAAVETFLKGGFLSEAKTELASIKLGQSSGLDNRLQLVRVEIDLSEHRVDEAAGRLSSMKVTQLPAALRARYYDLHAQVLKEQGNIAGSLQERIQLDNILVKNSLEMKKNQQQLWDNLSLSSQETLQELSSSQAKVLAGWASLAILVKDTRPKRLAQAMQEWETRFPNHPASWFFTAKLLQSIPTQAVEEKTIALLLPPTGTFAEQAKAVENGFLTANYNSSSKDRPRIVPGDGSASKVLQEYERVVKDEGVDFVVGPLEKDAVATLVKNYQQFPIPTLVLNYLDPPITATNLYQFGLSPEDEVKEIAQKARKEGRQQAAILVPIGQWGNRLSSAFRTIWQQLEGQVVLEKKYNDQDFVTPIKTVVSSPADMVFVVALPHLARELKPLFNQNIGRTLSIYSTSHIYSGEATGTEQNINGLIFVDLPWILNPSGEAVKLQSALQQDFGTKSEKHKRMNALGVDAYQFAVLSLQKTASGSAPIEYQGQTGFLTTDNSGIVHRTRLPWAQFINGSPSLLPDR